MFFPISVAPPSGISESLPSVMRQQSVMSRLFFFAWASRRGSSPRVTQPEIGESRRDDGALALAGRQQGRAKAAGRQTAHLESCFDRNRVGRDKRRLEERQQLAVKAGSSRHVAA